MNFSRTLCSAWLSWHLVGLVVPQPGSRCCWLSYPPRDSPRRGSPIVPGYAQKAVPLFLSCVAFFSVTSNQKALLLLELALHLGLYGRLDEGYVDVLGKLGVPPFGFSRLRARFRLLLPRVHSDVIPTCLAWKA